MKGLICLLFFCWLINLSLSANMTLVLLKGNQKSQCLDGSPYGYYYRAGYGTGASSWIVHHQGGGWCYTLEDCASRSMTALGSSTSYSPSITSFAGFLSDNAASNPDYYNWNVVYLNYCDGSSFTGHTESPIIVGNISIIVRGIDNLQQTIISVRDTIMAHPKEIIITGCSAGGLATYLHVDTWMMAFPDAMVRGMADAGWFLDTLSVSGKSVYTPEMQNGFQIWNSSGGVNQACIEYYKGTNEEWKCIFAQYTYPHIKTPIFVFNSKYDSWQIPNILNLPCANNISSCNATEQQEFLDYGVTFMSTQADVELSKNGMWIDACYLHCQSLDSAWTGVTIQTANGKVSPTDAFTSWYKGIDSHVVQNCTYGCNPTCGNA